MAKQPIPKAKQMVKRNKQHKLLFEDADERQFIDLTTDWMAKEYDRMNQALFDGKLGGCKFEIFTSGRGSQGRTLGHFYMDRQGLKFKRNTRQIFVYDWNGREKFVTYETFIDICHPTIGLNGNYKWTYKGALSTLVHEMCHYYTYMRGYAPTRGHGPEFYSIARQVSAKSNEFFTVQRLATAEEMSELELDPALKAKKEARQEKRMMSFTPVLVFMKDDTVRLVNSQTPGLITKIVQISKEKRNVEAVYASQDEEVKRFIFSTPKKGISRTYRFYTITKDDPIVQEFLHHKFDTWYQADDIQEAKDKQMAEDIIKLVNEGLKNLIHGQLD